MPFVQSLLVFLIAIPESHRWLLSLQVLGKRLENTAQEPLCAIGEITACASMDSHAHIELPLPAFKGLS